MQSISKRVVKRTRLVVALCAIGLAAAGLTACGGGMSGNVAVQIGGDSISKATFAHWMTIAAHSSSAPGATPAAAPVPPNFTACIASLPKTVPAKGQAPPTPAALKAQCAQQYQSLQTEVLGFLIST